MLDDLDELESKSIYILREARAAFAKLAMLWSVGKDSSVMLWLAKKAFFGRVPFPVVHVDTSYKIPEMIAFRDRLAREWGLDLVVSRNEAVLGSHRTLDDGIVAIGKTYPNNTATRVECCGALKTEPLNRVIREKGYDAVIAGIRRDEEGTRAKERVFSPRGVDNSWDVKEQPPELWDQFKIDVAPGAHVRVHPLLHWTEIDVWRYIERESIPVVPIYFAHDGVRYRSLGCGPCTKPIASTASTTSEIIAELRTTKIAERSTRAQDQESEHAFEQLRTQGYM
jgi:sulfate adenylyltransferase subunit 2